MDKHQNEKPIWQKQSWTKGQLAAAYLVESYVLRSWLKRHGIVTGRTNYLTPLEVQQIVEKCGIPPAA